MDEKGFRHRIARVTLVRCYSSEDAAATEATLIDFYRCELNVLDGSGRPVSRQDERVISGEFPGRYAV